MGVSLQDITFSTLAPDGVTDRIRVTFEYSDDKQQTWNVFSYDLPNDMFDIAVEEREQIAIELIMAIARSWSRHCL